MRKTYPILLLIGTVFISFSSAKAAAAESCEQLSKDLNIYFSDIKNWKQDGKNWYSVYRTDKAAGGVIVSTEEKLEEYLKDHPVVEKIKVSSDENLQYYCQYTLNSGFKHYMGPKVSPKKTVAYNIVKE